MPRRPLQNCANSIFTKAGLNPYFLSYRYGNYPSNLPDLTLTKPPNLRTPLEVSWHLCFSLLYCLFMSIASNVIDKSIEIKLYIFMIMQHSHI